MKGPPFFCSSTYSFLLLSPRGFRPRPIQYIAETKTVPRMANIPRTITPWCTEEGALGRVRSFGLARFDGLYRLGIEWLIGRLRNSHNRQLPEHRPNKL
jgi:hypothetical protein